MRLLALLILCACTGQPYAYVAEGDFCRSGVKKSCGYDLWDCESGAQYTCAIGVLEVTEKK